MLAADYGDASQEDAARALHAHRRDESDGGGAGVPMDGFTKLWLRLDIGRDEEGIPIVVGITD